MFLNRALKKFGEHGCDRRTTEKLRQVPSSHANTHSRSSFFDLYVLRAVVR